MRLGNATLQRAIDQTHQHLLDIRKGEDIYYTMLRHLEELLKEQEARLKSRNTGESTDD